MALRALERHPESLGLWNPWALHTVPLATDSWAQFPRTLLREGIRVLSMAAMAEVVLQGKGSHGGSAEPAAAPHGLRTACPP